MTVFNVIRQPASCDLVDLTTLGEKNLEKDALIRHFQNHSENRLGKKLDEMTGLFVISSFSVKKRQP